MRLAPRSPFLALVLAVLVVVAVETAFLVPEPTVALLAVEGVLAVALVMTVRAPLIALSVAVGVGAVAMDLELLGPGSIMFSVGVPAAAFLAGVSARPGPRTWAIMALLGAAYVAGRTGAKLGTEPVVVAFAIVRFTGPAVCGCLVRYRRQRVAEVQAEHDAVAAALAGGPSDAATAEHLRLWAALEERLSKVVAEVLREANAAAAGLSAGAGEAAMRLEALRLRAVQALDDMHASLRLLSPGRPGAADPPVPFAVDLGSSVDLGTAARIPAEVRATVERLADAVAGCRVVGESRARASRDRLHLRFFVDTPPATLTRDLRLVAARARLLGGSLTVRGGATGRRAHIVLRLPLGTPPVRGRRSRRRALPPADPYVAACLLLLAGALAEQVLHPPVETSVAGFAVAALLGLAPLLAPSRPLVAAALVGGAILGGTALRHIGDMTTVQNFIAALTVLAVGTTATPRRFLLGLVLVLGGLLAGLYVEPFPYPAIGYVNLALYVLIWGAAGWLLRDIAAEHAAAGGRLAAATEELEALHERVLARERVRLARELHDVVGHALTAVALNAGAAAAQVLAGRPNARDALDAVVASARLAATELGRVSAILGDEDRPAPPPPAPEDPIAELVRRAGHDARLQVEGDLGAVEPGVRQTLERIVAEALTNASKHAAGAAVSVRVAIGPSAVSATVENAPGASRGLPGSGRGLQSMAARAAECGGTLTWGASGEGGWVVRASLPAQAPSSRVRPGSTSPLS